jgi:hypothetical protein
MLLRLEPLNVFLLMLTVCVGMALAPVCLAVGLRAMEFVLTFGRGDKES